MPANIATPTTNSTPAADGSRQTAAPGTTTTPAAPQAGTVEPDADAKPDCGIPVHPVCDLLPLMDGDDFRGLCSDIREHGLINPIVIHEGQILDGRNRFLACQDVGVKPSFIGWRQLYHGPMSVTRWIWSVNVERRHLTLDQVLALEVSVTAFEEREAALKREKSGKSADGTAGGRGRKKNRPPSTGEGLPNAKPHRDRSGETARKIANEVGTTKHKAQQALNVQKADPDLLKQVARGETTLRSAAKKVQPKNAAVVQAQGAARETCGRQAGRVGGNRTAGAARAGCTGRKAARRTARPGDPDREAC